MATPTSTDRPTATPDGQPEIAVFDTAAAAPPRAAETPTPAVPSPLTPVPAWIDPERETVRRSSAEIRRLLDARAADLQFRVQAIKNEVTQPASFTVGGLPLPEALRQNALRYAGIAAAAGAVLGLLMGVRSARRARRRAPDPVHELLQARISTFFDDAAARVRPGVSPEEALRETLRRTPIVPLPPPYAGATAGDQASSSMRQVIDLAVKSATGFAIKAGMDAVTKKVTGYATTGDAIAAASDD